MPAVDYPDIEGPNGFFNISDSDDEYESDGAEPIYPRETISTLKLIGDYVCNLPNAKNTVVGVIQNAFHILISKYFRLSVTSFIYLEIAEARSAKVRSLR